MKRFLRCNYHLHRCIRVIVVSTIVTTLVSCGTSLHKTQTDSQKELVVLAMNDVYRLDNLAALRHLRAKLEKEHPQLLVLHAGDLLYPSLLSGIYDGEQMIDVLNRLDGDEKAFDQKMIVTFGNHEFDKSKFKHVPNLHKRIKDSQFHWLSSNIEFARNSSGESVLEASNHRRSIITESGGIRVGIFSLTTDKKTAQYITSFEDPIETAKEMTSSLRQQGAELVIALTHLVVNKDKEILDALGDQGPDIIFGGHDHDRQAFEVNGRWVLKADADAKSVTVAHIRPDKGAPPGVSYRFEELGESAPFDATLQRHVHGWWSRHEAAFCKKKYDGTPDCLTRVVGLTKIPLKAEELTMRRFETNLGNWLADQALQAFSEQGAQIAFINSGSIRLNRDIPARSKITVRDMDELLPYPGQLRLIRLNGATLQRVVNHAVSDWTGNGHWLQISGFAYRHNPDATSADSLTLLSGEGPRLIRPEDTILAVTNEYLIGPDSDQDGFLMLNSGMLVAPNAPAPKLKDLAYLAFKSEKSGIAPELEGRICNTHKDGPCLALK